MRSILRALFLAAAITTGLAQVAYAQGAAFADKALAEEAQRYEATLKSSVKVVPGKAAKDLRRDLERTKAGANADVRQVLALAVQTTVADANDADAWLALADALLAVPIAQMSGNERSELPQRAAAAAYREALQERPRDRAPLVWAATQENLAFALLLLGELTPAAAQLQQAVAAYQGAIEVYRDQSSLQQLKRASANLLRAETSLARLRKP